MISREQLLSSKYHRRWFLTIAVLAILVLLSLTHFLLPSLGGLSPSSGWVLASKISENLLVALISALAALAVFLWLTPTPMQKNVVSVVHPGELKTTLAKSLEHTTEHWYIGHVGSWTAAITLPTLARRAKEEGLPKALHLVLLDPRDSDACARYVAYRRGLRTGQATLYQSPRDLQLRIMAAVIAAVCWNRQPLLKVRVGLVRRFVAYRVDLTSTMAILTTEDPRVPALCVEKESEHYGSLKQSTQLTLDQADELPLGDLSADVEQLTRQVVGDLITRLGMSSINASDSELDLIIERARRPENPYPG